MRFITLANARAPPIRATFSIGVGSTLVVVHELLGMRLLKAQLLSERHPSVQLDIHVDDVAAAMVFPSATSAARHASRAWDEIVATVQ